MGRKVSTFDLLTGIDLTGDRIPILDMSSSGQARSRLVSPQIFLDEVIEPTLTDYALESYVNNVSGDLNNKINLISSGTGVFISQNQTGQFYSASNPSGFITGVNLNGYATETYVNNVSGDLNDKILEVIEFLPNVVSLTGGTSTCLDGISVNSYIAGKKVVSFVYSGVPFQLKHYYFVDNPTGQYTGDGNGIIVPISGSNKVWISL